MKHKIKRAIKKLLGSITSLFEVDSTYHTWSESLKPAHPEDTGCWERTCIPGLRPQDHYSIN